jgi:site-specific DNA-cytosine methylase
MCFKAIREALEGTSISMQFFHEFSAEHACWKRDFIQLVAKPRRLLRDVFELSAQHAWDCNCKEWFSPLTEFANLDLFIIGFVCKTVSALNADKNVAKAAILSSTTSTGSTFKAALLFMERAPPKCAILENVLGLMVNNQHLLVIDLLEDIGFITVALSVNALDFGHPQSRPRLYFIAFRKSSLDAAGVDAIQLSQMVREMYDAMQHAFVDLFPINDVLTSEEDPHVQAIKAQALERVDQLLNLDVVGFRKRKVTAVASTPKWVCKHKKLSEACSRSAWRDGFVDRFPEYMLLPDRCKDMLDHQKVQFPANEPIVLNISQSKVSSTVGYSSCVTPKAMLWLAERGRFANGHDFMALQAIHISNYDAVGSVLSDSQLKDLAGNAFCAVNSLAAQILALFVLTMLQRRLAHGSSDADATSSSSSGDDWEMPF